MPTSLNKSKKKNRPSIVASEFTRRLGADWCRSMSEYIKICSETNHRGMRKNAWLRAEKKRKVFRKYLKSVELNDAWLKSVYKWK